MTLTPHSLRRTRRTLTAALAALVLTGCAVQGGASDTAAGDGYPARSVELTAPSSAGGSTDLISRALAKSMEKPLGQSIVVVNRPGANGAVGGKEVLSSRADGYKMVIMPQSLFAIGPLLEQDPDAIKLSDMTILTGLTVEDYVLVVPADSPIKNLDDLIESAPFNYGTTGAGTGSQLAQALLYADAGAKATDVPFDGGSAMLTALLGNQVEVGASQVAEAAPQIDAGKLRAIAVFSRERIDFLKDVPTAVEQGHDVVVDQRRWLAAPAGLPEEVTAKLREAITAATRDPAYDTFLKTNYVGRWEVDGAAVAERVEAATKEAADLAREFGLDFTERS